MKSEKSCGAVVFTRISGQLLYVIIKSKEGIYGFPKGHMEGKETEVETAIREVQEETGLQIALVEGFRVEDSYPVIREGAPVFMKHVVYFLGQYNEQIIVPQETEVTDIQLMDYDTAMASFQFENLRHILAQAHNYLGGLL